MPERSDRLLQIFNRTLGGGGEELATRQIARILSRECEFAETIFESSDWKASNAPPPWKQALFTFYNPHSIKRVREAQAQTKADAWVLHNFLPVLSGGIFRESLRQRVPIIQYIHNFRPFSVSSYLWIGRHLDPARWPQNFLHEIRHGTWQGSRAKTAFLASVLTTLHVTRQFRAIKAWIAVSKFMREKFISAGVAPESIFQIYNPWVLRYENPSFPEGDYYLFLGRLIEEKGIKIVVEAWHTLRKERGVHAPRLIVGGDGPLADWVKAAATKNPSIEYRGYVAGQEKDLLLQNCRAQIVPSIWWDPLPYVVYEAYDSGKPVLASASGGLTELVQHGETGFHHVPGNIDELVRQVLELDADPILRRQMGVKGREWLIANTNDTKWREQFFRVVDYVKAAPHD